MSNLRQAAQQALEALEEINELSIGENAICLPAEIDAAMDAIRTALKQQAEPVQERSDGMPTSKAERDLRRMLCVQRHGGAAYMDDGEASFCGDAYCRSIDYMRESIESIRKAWYDAGAKKLAGAQPVQQAEPVAWMDREGDLYKMPEIPKWAPPHTMLYTTPPQRQWVGLTDEDIQAIHDTYYRRMGRMEFAQKLEAKLKEKNA